MKSNTWMAIVTAAFATACAPSLAADTGFYLAAGVGQSEEEPKSIGANFSLPFSAGIVHLEPVRVDVDESGVAWSVAAGYRINTYLAAEIEYLSFGTTHVNEHYSNDQVFPFPIELDHAYSSKVTGPALSLLGSMPLGGQFQVFLRAGVLFADRELQMAQFDRVDETFASTVWLGGAGVNWAVASRWAVRAEYQQTGKFDETLLAGESELRRVALSVLFEL